MSRYTLGFVLGLLVLGMMHATKDKKKDTKKKPIAVTDPLGLRSFEDWVNLGEDVLSLSCRVASLPAEFSAEGTICEMARRLFEYYQDMLAQESVGKLQIAATRYEKVFFFASG